MKTCNLNQSSLRNDQITGRMYGFSFYVFEDEIEVQDVIFPRSLDQIPISSIPWMRKRVKNARKLIGTRIVVSRKFDYLENSRAVFPFRRTVYLKRKLGVIVRWTGSLQSTVAMKHLLIETVQLSGIRSITDGGLRWVHVFKWRGASLLIICWIFIQRSWYVEESTDRDWSRLL